MISQNTEKFSENLKLTIKSFQKVKHIKTGNLYQIIVTANEFASEDKREKFPLTVVYKRLSDNTIWSRKYEDFIKSFEDAEIHGF